MEMDFATPWYLMPDMVCDDKTIRTIMGVPPEDRIPIEQSLPSWKVNQTIISLPENWSAYKELYGYAKVL